MAYEDEKSNPYKWTYVPRVRHKAKKCTNCLGIITNQQKCLKDKLLIYESNRNKVFFLPVAQSSVNSRENPAFQIALLLTILQSIDSMMGDLHWWPPGTGAAYSLLSRRSESQARFI